MPGEKKEKAEEDLSLHDAIEKELKDVPEGGEEIKRLVLEAAKLHQSQNAKDNIDAVMIHKIIVDFVKLFPPEKLGALHGYNSEMTVKVEPIYVWKDYRLIENEVQLEEVINEARTYNKILRVIGSGHAPKRAREGLDSDEAKIKCILTGQFREMSYESLPVGESGKEAQCVIAGAGMHLSHDPLDPTSCDENGLLYQLAERGWALNDLGGVANQTVAGFLGTGGSGGSIKYAFWDGIVAIEVMDGLGMIHKFTNPEYETYHKQCGSVKGFEAVGVSMGLMGVITKVIFKLTPLYWIKGEELTVVQDDPRSVVCKKNGKNVFRWEEASNETANTYMRVNYFAAPGNKYAKPLRNVTQWTGQRMPHAPAKIVPYISVTRNAQKRFVAILGLKLNEIYPCLRNFLLSLFCQPTTKQNAKTEFCDVYWKTLPMDKDSDEDNGFRVDFTEIWVPQRHANEALLRLREAWDADPLMPGNFVTELYAAKKSPFWLGMSHEEDMFRIDAFWYHYSIVTNNAAIEEARYAFYQKYWDVFATMEGATFHWGKYLPDPLKFTEIGPEGSRILYDQNLLRKRYKHFDDWLAFRKTMDPENIFLTNYWKKHLFIPGN